MSSVFLARSLTKGRTAAGMRSDAVDMLCCSAVLIRSMSVDGISHDQSIYQSSRLNQDVEPRELVKVARRCIAWVESRCVPATRASSDSLNCIRASNIKPSPSQKTKSHSDFARAHALPAYTASKQELKSED